jgi:recombination associated protein RdgC
MWFKNLQIYRLPADWSITPEKLEEQLAKKPFAPCGSTDLQSLGWISPRKGGGLVHAAQGQMMLALAVEQKLLPASVINQEAQDKIEAFEEQQGYAPSRKQAKEIKEEVTLSLLPRAFTRRRTTYIWLDAQRGWLYIDAASVTKAETVIETLTRTVDDLPLSLLKTELSPATAMINWLTSGEAPVGFTVDRDCELRAPVEENATVRYVRHLLGAEEIGKHITEGKLPTRLALTWDDRISFILTERLEIKRLGFLDILKEEASQSAETADEQFDADFVLMTGELARMIPALVGALGGEMK